MQTLRDWLVSVIGDPVFHKVIDNPNYTSGYNRYTIIEVQYDWAFIASALIFVICLWGFISLLRMAFGRHRHV